MSESSGRYSGPDRPTVDLPKTEIIEGLLRSMQQQVQEGFASVNAEVGNIKADVHHLVEDHRLMRDRVGLLEQRVNSASGRFKAVTSADEEHARSLAGETQKRKALETELIAARERLDTVTNELANVTSKLTNAEKVAEETKGIAVEAKGIANDTKTLAEDTKKLTVAQTAELQQQTAILTRLSNVAANPVVKDLARTVATAVTTALATWAALK